jgi:tetratricopeptide (TPR) repeat protein
VDFRRGAEINAHNAQSVTGVLEVFLRMNRPADGLLYYEQYAPKDLPTSALVSKHARLLAAAGQETAAVSQFRRAMALAMGESIDAARQVAGDIRAAMDPGRAIELFGAPGGDPGLERANQRVLARLYPMVNRFSDAAASLEQLLRTSTVAAERAELYAELGEVHQVSGQYEDAKVAYEEALKINDRNWVVLNNLAYLLSDTMGEHALARPYAERAVATQEHASALDTLGWIYVGLGDYSSAVAELSRAVSLNSDDPLHYYHLGEAHRRSGQRREAIDVLQSGLDVARAAGQSASISQIDSALLRARDGDQKP